MTELLKKYWFIGLVGVCLIGATIFFATEQQANIIEGKTENGENVIYSIADENVTANEFYNEMYAAVGTDVVAQRFVQALYDAIIETTPELEAEAKEQADLTIQQLKATYGAEYDTIMENILNGLGYENEDEFYLYALANLKQIEVLSIGAKELFPEFSAEKQPRIISHILVSLADPENPTEEEQAKMDAVLTSLSDGKSFAEVAIEYSDDTGSATNGGSLGYTDIDAAEAYVPEFKDAIFTLEPGIVSEWVYTQYGAHLILFDANDFDSLLQYPNDFLNTIMAYDESWLTTYLKEQAETIGYTFTDPALQQEIEESLGFTTPEPEVTEEPEATVEPTVTPDAAQGEE